MLNRWECMDLVMLSGSNIFPCPRTYHSTPLIPAAVNLLPSLNNRMHTVVFKRYSNRMWDSTELKLNVSCLYNGIHYWQIRMSTVVGSANSSHKLHNKLCNLSFSVKISDSISNWGSSWPNILPRFFKNHFKMKTVPWIENNFLRSRLLF
jgi:hypothetical protein